MEAMKNPATEPPGQGSESRQQSHSGGNSTYPRPGVQDHSAYAELALSGIIDDFHAACQAGGRNDALNGASFKAGQLIGGGILNRGTTEQALAEAARSVGIPDHEAASTIRSGLNSGVRSPRGPDDRQPEGNHRQGRRQTPPPGRQATPDQAARAALVAQQVIRLAKSSDGTHGYSVKKMLPVLATLLEMRMDLFIGATGWHPKGKNGQLIGERLIVLPVHLADDAVVSVQLIDEPGRKAFLVGSKVTGGYWSSQALPDGNGAGHLFYLGEGAATALSAAQGRQGRPGIAIAALMDSNLPAVARMLRERYPAADICVLADLLPSGESNRHAVAAARESGCRLFKPDFGPNRQPDQKDANDVLVHLGPEEFARQLATARLVEPEAATQTAPREDDQQTDTPIDWDGSDTHSSQFQVKDGNLPSAVRHAEAALLASGDVYQQGGQLIRLMSVGSMQENGGIIRQAGTLIIRRVDLPWLGLKLGEVTTWVRYNARAKTLQPIDCPQQVAIAVLGDSGRWPFPELLGTIDTPTLRPDGSVLHTPGYDQSTGLWLAENSVRLDHAALEKPSESDARKALGKLKALIGTFPFVTEADRSVALSGILTAPIRRSIPTSPLHAYSAPVPGSGKSKLVDLAAVGATGRPATVINHGRTDDEFEKRLGASLLAGDYLIAVDNISRPLGGDLLCQALTQSSLKIRPLGASVQAVVPSRAFIATTGNNLVLPADMTRRTVLCTIDPACERPELRRFDSDPVTTALSNRDELLTAALVILRAHHLAGRPGMDLIPLGSFEVWSGWVRAALVWLGEADPCQTIESVRSADPELQRLQAVLVSWHAAYGNQRVSVQEIIRDIASQHRPEQMSVLREALLAVAGDGGAVNSRRLGIWLGHNKKRIVNSMLVDRVGMRDGNQLWAVSAQAVDMKGLRSPLQKALSKARRMVSSGNRLKIIAFAESCY